MLFTLLFVSVRLIFFLHLAVQLPDLSLGGCSAGPTGSHRPDLLSCPQWLFVQTQSLSVMSTARIGIREEWSARLR